MSQSKAPGAELLGVGMGHSEDVKQQHSTAVGKKGLGGKKSNHGLDRLSPPSAPSREYSCCRDV